MAKISSSVVVDTFGFGGPALGVMLEVTFSGSLEVVHCHVFTISVGQTLKGVSTQS